VRLQFLAVNKGMATGRNALMESGRMRLEKQEDRIFPRGFRRRCVTASGRPERQTYEVLLMSKIWLMIRCLFEQAVMYGCY
jgi:hypothetical protein